MSFFKSLFKQTLAGILSIILIIGIISIIMIGVFSEDEVELPDTYSVYVEIEEMPEKVDPDLSSELFEDKFQVSSLKLQKTLQHLSQNPKVNTVIFNFTSCGGNWSNYIELGNQIKELRKTKKVICYSDAFSFSELYAAQYANQIVVHPLGEVEFKGLGMQLVYFKDLLNSIGIEAQPIRAGKYKSAIEPFIENDITAANKEQLTAIVQSLWKSLSDSISLSRNISVSKLDQIANEKGYLHPNEAIANGLIDSSGFLSDLIDVEKSKYENVVKISNYCDYYDKELMPFNKNNIGVLTLEGVINVGKSDDEISVDFVLNQIKKLKKDSAIKAVVVRVNSPGGSALASETIYQSLKQLQKVKPIVFSMGEVAASGGYYIAMASDYVFSQSTTITGSIGVYGMMINTEELNEKLGIKIAKVKSHELSDFPSINRPLSELERNRFQSGIDSVYQIFLERVSENRGLTVNQVHELAQGRVWSGADAKKHQLVDELGGLDDAILYAAKMKNLTDYSIRIFPKEKTFFEQLTQQIDQSATIKLPPIIQELVYLGEDLSTVTAFKKPQMRLPFKILK